MDDVVLAHVNDDGVMPLRYRACGLSNIILLSGYEIEEFDGEQHVAVKDAHDLHRAIGYVIATKASSPSPEEMKFLREEMNLTQMELGLLLGLSSQAVARYEKGKVKVGGPAERLLRAIYMDHIDENVDIVDFVEALAELDETPSDDISLTYDDGWSTREAAYG